MKLKLLTLTLAIIGLSIANAQNVGIGQNNPKSKLDINGNLVVGSGTGYSGSATTVPANGAIIQGPVGIGTVSPNSNAILDLSGTPNMGLLLPQISTSSETSITPSSTLNGLVFYNSSTNCLDVIANGIWQSMYCPCPALSPTVTGTTPVCPSSTNNAYSVTPMTGASTYSWSLSAGSFTTTPATNATSVSVTAPSSGTFNVSCTVSNACGTAYVASKAVTVTAVPGTPTWSSTPSASVCASQSITYALAAPSGTAPSSYNWTFTNNTTSSITVGGQVLAASGGTYTFSAVSTTSYSVPYGSGSGTFSISVTANYTPCSYTTSALTASVTVNALPTISGGSSVCTGATIALTGSGTPATTNTWTSGTTADATVTGTNSTTVTVSGVASGSSVITYTNSNGCQATQTVNVNTSPTISGTLSTCIGNNTVLTGTGTPATTGTWSSATMSVATVTGTNSTTGTVTGVAAGSSVITYNTSNGCNATATVTVNSSGSIVLDNSVAQTASITAASSGELIIIDMSNTGGSTSSNTMTLNSGLTTTTITGSQSYTAGGVATGHYSYAYGPTTAGTTYTFNPGQSGGSGYWTTNAFIVKNTCGTSLSPSNVHEGTNYYKNTPAATTSVSVGSSTTVPAGAFLVGTAYDGNGFGSYGFSWSSPTGMTAIRNTYDGGDGDDGTAGVTLSSSVTNPTVTESNSSGYYDSNQLLVFWIY